MKLKPLLPVLAIALLLTAYSCTKDKTIGVQPANEVTLLNTAFNPTSTTVPVGTTVSWTNRDGQDHTVTSDSGVFDSGILHDQGVFTFTFTKAGNYPYHCQIHSSMLATVIVQ